MKVLIPALSLVALLLPAGPDVSAHRGGLDGCGCHAGSQPYHCHANACRYCPDSFDCKGRVRITTIPKAEVWIDGKRIGASPITTSAQHGAVTVAVRHRLLGSATRVVHVEYGKTANVDIRW